MRRIAFLLCLLLLASTTAVFAADRHLILKPAQPLTEAAKAALAERGITVQKVLTGGRFIVLVEPVGRGPRIASLEELQSVGELQTLRSDWKIDRSVSREVARLIASARLRVLFHDDITLDDARSAVSAAGGTVRDPLQVTFGVMRSLEVAVPAEGVQVLASDDRVLAMAASERFPMESHNENSARTTKVALVQAAPYNLSGEGVTVSIFELGKPQATHPEFQGRLTANGDADGGESDQSHATHVAGSIMSAGLGIGSKGMAPKAKLQSFVVAGKRSEWLDAKGKLPTFGSFIDSNSWGYVLGWKTEDGNAVWNGNDSYYGSYDLFYTAPIDQITREQNVLFVHSSGNDAAGVPLGAWNQHKHVDDETGDAIVDKTWCYSKDGTGNDCPTSFCTAGPTYCETKKHMPDLPFWTVGLTASGKNTIAVGSVSNFDKTIASSSSRGPARDGRIKPDLVAPGMSVYSTIPGNTYGTKSGTSMAAPMVTGTSALLVEQWRKTFSGANPLPAELKGLLVAGAEDLGNSGPDYTYGHGLIDAKASVDLILADGGARKHIRRASVATGQTYEMKLTQAAAGKLKVVLQWTDPEILPLGEELVAAKALVNDLDVKVIGPTGTETLPFVLNKDNIEAPATRAVNTIDNTEVVEIANAPAGMYRALITGRSVIDKSPQEFVVVTTAAAAPPCVDAQEKGDTSETAYGLAKGDAVTGALCSNTDVDYYRFTVTQGPGAVRITTGGSAIRATVIAQFGPAPTGLTNLSSIEVAANTTATLPYDLQSGLPITPPPNQVLLLKIEPIGELAATSTYTIVPTFEVLTPAKRRSARR
ncbi:MAG: S8 family serine peptidase [Thermoanaerobaculia bacterium]